MECFGTNDFDNSRLITLSAIIISGLHCIMTSPKFFEKCVDLATDTKLTQQNIYNNSKLIVRAAKYFKDRNFVPNCTVTTR
jgi:hypothetical protein